MRGMYNDFKRAKQEIRQMTGETFEVTRGDRTHTAVGVKVSKENYIAFFPEDDVQVGDVLRSTASNKVFYVVDTDEHTVEGKVLEVKAVYETDIQRARRAVAEKAPSQTFTFNAPVHGSILGSQQHFTQTNTFDLRQLEIEIERRGGEDVEELKEMARQFQELLAGNETIDKSALARFSALMERHSWITGTFAQGLLAWAMGGS